MEGPAHLEKFPVGTDLSQPLESPELIRMFKDLEPGEFVLDERFLPGLSRRTTDVEFINDPRLYAGRENSRHGVQFGRMIIHAADDRDRLMDVAIKPFDNQYDLAAHEYAATSLIHSGAVPGFHTFRPWGVTRMPDTDFPANVTVLDFPVETMDSIFWDKETMANADAVDHNLGRAAVELKIWHEVLAHRDASPRNMPVNVMVAPVDTFVNDLETVRFLAGLSHEEKAALRREDLQDFTEELYEPLRFTDPKDRFALPKNYIDRILQNFALVYVGNHDGRKKRHALTFDELAGIIETARDTAFAAAAKL